jgi:hypothetical protein
MYAGYSTSNQFWRKCFCNQNFQSKSVFDFKVTFPRLQSTTDLFQKNLKVWFVLSKLFQKVFSKTKYNQHPIQTRKGLGHQKEIVIWKRFSFQFCERKKRTITIQIRLWSKLNHWAEHEVTFYLLKLSRGIKNNVYPEEKQFNKRTNQG